MAIPGPKVSIREIRKAHGLTLADLAERIKAYGVEVHPDTLSNVELGYRRAARPLLVAWAHALALTPLDVEQAELEDVTR